MKRCVFFLKKNTLRREGNIYDIDARGDFIPGVSKRNGWM